MGRWEPDARGRLEQAALELYGERGFERTTVAEIAERAGLTERTFYRYFADKREVLFWGSGLLRERLVTALEEAPASLAPLDAVGVALLAVVDVFDERQEFARQRQAVIAASVELQERERIKLATLASALADALRRRGVTDPSAVLAAETGIAVFKVAFEKWIDGPGDQGLDLAITESLDALKEFAAGRAPGRRR
jgi:AcrR family transcriptional regulator